jgi:hypothetical protein
MFGVVVVTMIHTMAPFAGLRIAEAAGPWKAQIVNAETGQPLEGVVVLAYWLKMTRGPGGASPSFYDAEEVVTGPDGRFTIPSRSTFTLNPFTYIKDAQFKIFKPGYGAWGIRGWKGERPKEWQDLTVGEILTKEGIVIELPPLRTRDERLRFYHGLSVSPPTLVPPDRTKRLDEAIRMERAYLGFRN